MNDLQKKIIEHVKNHDVFALNEIIKENKALNLNFTDLKGQTLLHHAVAKTSKDGMPMLQKLLAEFNLDPNAVDEKFESSLDVARKSNNIPGLTILKYYINKKELEQKSYL